MNRASPQTWTARPQLARAVRVLAAIGPLAVAVGVSLAVARMLPPAPSMLAALRSWLLLSVVSTLVLIGCNKLVRRLLPLAVLLKLTLVFPDKAPSRYKLARSVATTRQLEAEVERARTTGSIGDREKAAETVLKLVAALSVHDRATRGHAERVRIFGDMIAEEMGLSKNDQARLRWSSLLHDVGKITVHPDILNKAGKPTEEEWEALRSHPLEGARITAPLRQWLGDWALAIEQHHEQWDGSGYPYALAGKEISLGARIVSVADVFDVMTSARSYKEAMTTAEARAELARCAGTQFDPEVVRAFLSIAIGRLRWATGPFAYMANAVALRPLSPLGGLSGLAAAAGVAAAGIATYGFVPSVAPAVTDEPIAVSTVDSTEAPLPAITTEPQPRVTPTLSELPLPDETVEPSRRPSSDAPVPTPRPTAEPVLPTPVTTPVPAPTPRPTTPAPAANVSPILKGDRASTSEDTPLVLDVLANDTDADGDSLTLMGVTIDAGGRATSDVDGRVLFVPSPDFSGRGTGTTFVSDGTVDSRAVLIIDVVAVNDVPRFTSGPGVILSEDGPPTVLSWATGIDAGALNEREQALTFEVATADLDLFVAAPTIDREGNLVVTPRPNANGATTMTVTLVDDGAGTPDAPARSPSALVDVVVRPVDDPHVVAPDKLTVREDDLATIVDVLANDTDIDGDTLVVTSVGRVGTRGAVAIDRVTGLPTYRPLANDVGVDTFTYRVTDGTTIATGTVTVTITPVPDAPVAVDDVAATRDDVPIAVDVLANDTDADGDQLAVSAISSVSAGTARVQPDGTVLVTPPADVVGDITVGYVVADPSGLTDSGLLVVSVVLRPVPPTAADDAVTIAEDTRGVVIDVLANDLDRNPGDVVSVVRVDPTALALGRITDLGDGTVRYVPDPDVNGLDSFGYTISDGGLEASATVTVTIDPVPDAPVANDDLAATSDDTPILVDVLANDSDVDGDPLSVLRIDGVSGGTATLDPTGAVLVTPTPDVSGAVLVDLTITDPSGLTDTSRLVVTVTLRQLPPTAGADTATIDEDSLGVVIDLLANDDDRNPGDVLTVTGVDVAGLTLGVLTDLGGGLVRYVPAPDANGVDTAGYTVTDGVFSTSGTITITVLPVPDPPVAVDDAAVTTDDQAVQVDVVANDTDPDGDAIVVASIDNVIGVGTATLVSGQVLVTPTRGATGQIIVTLTVSDPTARTATSTLTVDVTIRPFPPVANDDTATVDEDATGVSIDLLANDVDPNPGDEVTLVDATSSTPQLGTVESDGSGVIIYVPSAEVSGTDVFTYTITDGGLTATGTVTVTINPIPDAPQAGDDAFTTAADTELVVPVGSGLLSNDGDEDGDALQVDVAASDGPVLPEGLLTLQSDGSFTFLPNNGVVGTIFFTYVVTDGALTDTGTVSVTLAPGPADRLWLTGTPSLGDASLASTTPPVSTGNIAPDHDGDNSPGTTIRRSRQFGTETDRKKFHSWNHETLTDLVLNGPVSLDLWSSTADFDPTQDLDWTLRLFDCDAAVTACTLINEQVHVHTPSWNRGAATWVHRTLSIGNVNHTVPAGRVLQVAMQVGHTEIWLPLSAELPAILNLTIN